MKNISIYTDGMLDIQYKNVFQGGGAMIVSSFMTSWSDVNAIKYYTQKDYFRSEPDPYYQDYFKEKDWKVFSEEQLIFDEDTLHLCVY